MGGFASVEEIFALSARILWDDIPKVDTVVMFAETIVNKLALLKTLSHLWFEGIAKNIAVSGFDGCAIGELIVPGFEEIMRNLLDRAIPEDHIFRFPLSSHFPPSTDAEALGLVEYARKAHWKTLCLVGTPLHQFRMFISTVSAIIKSGQDSSELAVWNCPSDVRQWDEEIFHSASVSKGKRRNLILTELSKVERYYQEGSLVSAAEVLEYMNQRKQQEL